MIAATCDMYQYLSRCPIIISSTARNDNNNTDTHVLELRDPSVISLINYTVHPEPHIFLQGDQTHIRICMVNKMLEENHKNKQGEKEDRNWQVQKDDCTFKGVIYLQLKKNQESRKRENDEKIVFKFIMTNRVLELLFEFILEC